MPSPSSSSPTSTVSKTFYDNDIDSLLGLVKWGGAAGTGVTLTFSFPWTTNGSATFAGYNGAPYSSDSENTAAFHYGLDATQQAAARSALGQWAAVANVRFTEVADTASNVGDIRFAWTSATNATSVGTSAWGWTGYPNAFWPYGGDVWISTIAAGTQSWAAGSSNYKSLLHEIGHGLGLKHPFEGSPTLPQGIDSLKYSVMSYTQPDNIFIHLNHGANGSVSYSVDRIQPDTPMLLDILAIQYLYGANMSYRTGNDVYTFDPNIPFIRTIWDAGGVDEISVANFSEGCWVDLREGYYSNITILSDSTSGYNWNTPPPVATYDNSENLAIAYGCIIENATGGQGGDVLVGNDVGNELNGGAGNDTLDGGDGDDLFDWESGQRSGVDVFYGGRGNDDFVFDSASDSAIEYAGEGYDTVWVNFSFSLVGLSNIEQLSAYGSAGVRLTGSSGNNVLEGGSGNDTLDGGAGVDVAMFSGARASYSIVRAGTEIDVSGGSDGSDVLLGVERLSFSDMKLAFDIEGNAGQAYRLYQAAFNRTPDKGGLGFQMTALDNGLTLQQVAQNFINSPEFSATYGQLNTSQYVTQLYANVLHRAPDAGGLAFHVNRIDTGASRADVLVGFSESPENKAALIGIIGNGIVYTL